VLQNYASAFHIPALAAGFIVTRWVLPSIRREAR
jgi:hypothetical protein